MHLRGLGIVALAAIIFWLLAAASASATERLVYEAFPAPESEVEETGNLYVMEEGEEPQPLEIWGRNPSIDTRGRLVVFYENGGIYVTDYKGRATREVAYVGLSGVASPQWVPGHGLVTDGPGNIYVIDYTKPFPFLELGEVDWPGKQWAPAASPDGQRIAFLSETDPKGEFLEGGPAVFTTNLDGTKPVQVSNPEVAVPVGAPTFSPDGSHIAFDAFGEFNEWEEGDLVSVLAGGEGLTQLTSIPEGIAWDPDWLPNGHIVFTEERWSTGDMELLSVPGGGGEVQQMHAPFTNGEFAYHIAGRQPVSWEPFTSESVDRATQLLHLYAPTLKYDTNETYRATAVNSIFETYSGTEPEDSNQLVDSEGEVIQYANTALNPGGLRIWLAAQEKEYLTDPVPADESHRLDERNGSYAEDAAPWQEDPWYADISYGRAVYAEGHWWLQYWFWYYYDEFLLGFGDHEGDWEMVQIQLDEYGNPGLTTYAQHHDSEADTCNFNILDWTVGLVPNVSPVVYVADGTHASFIRSGLAVGNFPYDTADGEGYVARTGMLNMLEVFPVIGDVGGGYGRNWSLWPGRWGSSLGEGKSPMAPISQGEKWEHPGAFAEQAESCPREEEGTPQARIQGGMSRQPVPLRAPNIRADSSRSGVIVHYGLKGRQGNQKQGVEISVLGDKPVVTPVKRTAWKHDGNISLPFPSGEGPYTVVARSRARNGASSSKVTIELGGRHHQPVGLGVHGRPTLGPSADRSGSVLFGARFVRRLGDVQVKALRRRERRMWGVDRRLRNAPVPTVAPAFGDKSWLSGKHIVQPGD